MTIDISRKSFDQTKNYSGLTSEQGRVQLDADWNEGTAIADRRWRTQTLDVLGRCRVSRETPDAFRIDIDTGTLIIGPGRMYVDGLLAENHGGSPHHFDPVIAELTGTAALSFDQQPFLATAHDFDDGRYLVYLDVWQRDVTYLEDPELVDHAVGIPTTSRKQTVWQVKIHNQALDTDVRCSTPDEEIPGWQELIRPSDGRLSTRSVDIPSTDDPCLLSPSGGYRGLENRTYRVQIHEVDGNGKATCKWSRHNATVASTVLAVLPSLSELEVESIGKDSVLRFNNGDWVEILDDPLEFSGQAGIIRRIEKVEDATKKITLTEPLPASAFPTVDGNPDPKRHMRVRRWDQSGEIRDTNNILITDLDAENSDGVIPVPASGTSIVLEDGVQITFEALARPDGRYRAGDFWVFITRTNGAFVKELNHEPPCGIHHHYCKLALVDVVNSQFDAVVEDCRIPPFDEPGSMRSCCSVTVAPHESIQHAIDTLPAEGGRICLLAGDYRENIRIQDRRNITLTGCGRRSRIFSAVSGEVSGDTTPVISIINSMGIYIESMAVSAHTFGIGILVVDSASLLRARDLLPVSDIVLANLYINAARRSGIEVQGGKNVTIRGCHVEMEDIHGDWPGIFLIAQDALIQDNEVRVLPKQRIVASESNSIQTGRGGIQIGGASEQVRIINNQIRSGYGNGITLGSIVLVPADIDVSRFDSMAEFFTRSRSRVNHPSFSSLPEDGGGESMTPISGGALTDVLIADNDISRMGMSGIGVAHFFDLKKNPDLITTDRLTIEKNRIYECMQLDLLELPQPLRENAVFGGIALADGEYMVIRDNIIENNGTKFTHPICGIYIFHGQGITIDDNRILHNGRPVDSDVRPRPGERGGIVINFARSRTQFIDTRFFGRITRQDGVPATRIHGNIVVSPEGRALKLLALGPVTVENNQFTTQGSHSLNLQPLPDITFVGPRAFSLASAARVPFSVAREAAANNTSTAFLDALGGAVVSIVNLGVSNEAYGQLIGFSGLGLINALSNVGLRQADSKLIVNGNILFNDNQVVLDAVSPAITLALSSTLLISLDDISMEGNQCDCDLATTDAVGMNALVVALSLRATDNRFKEGISNAELSAYTFALMNATTDNQGTHCFFAVGRPDLSVISQNRSLVQILPPSNPDVQNFCDVFEDIRKRVAQQFGFRDAEHG